MQPDKKTSGFLEVAHRAADKAGAVLRHYFGAEISAELKADNSPVTLADRECEIALREVISEAFPAYGIIGEEMGAVNPDAEYQWVIDPIDGTRAFMAGKTTFTTLIALCHKNIPLLGIIDQPILNQRWAAEKPLTPAVSHPSRAGFTLATTSMDYFTAAQKNVFETLRAKATDVTLGGDAYSYAMLSEGHIDVVVDAGMKPYDYLALVAVVEAAGGVITDWSGQPLTLQSKGDVVACINSTLHEQIVSAL